MRQKLTRFSSLFLALLLFASAAFPQGSLTVHAAASLKAALKEESGNGIPADEGWSLFNALKKVPAANRSYINLTQGKHASWAQDEQSESEYNAMKPVYGADLADNTRYGIRYSNVELAGKKYNVTFAVDGVRGANGADKIIVFYDGQPGAVRFQGYKKCHFTITIDGIGSGEVLHTALTFQDIDCHQALEVTTPGNITAADKGSSTLKVGSDIPSGVRSDLADLGGIPDNTVFADTGTDQKDKDGSAGANKYRLDVDANFTSEHNEFKGCYYAGGGSDFLDQTNGVFFYFTGSFGATEYTPPNVVKAVNGKENHDLSSKNEVFHYTLTSTIGDDVQNVSKFGWHDTLADGLEYAGDVKVTKDGSDVTRFFDISRSGKKITVQAKAEAMAANPYGKFTATIPVKIAEGTDLEDHMEGNYAVFHNKGYVMWAQNGVDHDDRKSNDVTVRIRLAELALDKTVDKYEHRVGDDVVWTIKVTDKTAGVPALDVSMTDTIPSEYTVTDVSVSGGTGAKASHSGNKVTAQADSLNGGETMTVTVRSKALEAGNGKEMYNTASATCSNIANSGKKAEDDAEGHVNTADLSIDKAVDRYEYQVGETAHFTVKVKNTKGTANNVSVTDTLPSGMALKADTLKISYGSASVDYPVAGAADPTNRLNPELRNETEARKITASITKEGENGWKAAINHMPKNTEAVITFDAVAAKPGNGVEQRNIAAAKADNAATVSDDCEYFINTADLSIDKVIDRYEYEIGDTARFTVKVRNKEAFAKNVVITDALPSGMTLKEGSLKIAYAPTSVAYPVAGTADPTNKLNPELQNETETRKITAAIAKEGENGWKATVSLMPKNTEAVITFEAGAGRAGNGKEQQNVAAAKADNAVTVSDDCEYYINTAALSIKKKYINPYKAQKKDNRYDNEFRVFEEETGNEKVQYQVDVVSSGDDGTVAKDVVINDLTLPDGLSLNYDAIKIRETAAGGTVKEFTPAGGNGTVFKYRIAGTADTPNQIDRDKYDETEERTPVITLSRSGNGWKLTDSYLPKGAKLTISYDCNAEEKVNGSEILNTATATAKNVEKDKDGKYKTVTADAKVYINSPRLVITKKADSEKYEVGDTVTYTITTVNRQKGTIARNLVFDDTITTEGVKLQKTSVVLMDSEGTVIKEKEDTYDSSVKNNYFKLKTRKHLVKEEKHDRYDLYAKKDPETLESWNPEGEEYPGGPVTEETQMTIEYQMVVTDKDLSGKEIDNIATAVSDEALKVTDDEKVTPNPPNPQIEKTADKKEYYYGETASYTIRVTQERDAVTAKDVIIEDKFAAEDDFLIDKDSFKVTFNGEDITGGVEITMTEKADGFSIKTGKDMEDSDVILVTYKATPQVSSIGKDITNTSLTYGSNTPKVHTTEIVKVLEGQPRLKIEKASDKAEYEIGETGKYIVAVTQVADNVTARNVVIDDEMQVEGTKISGIRIADPDGKDITEEVKITKTERGYSIATGKDLAQGETFTVTYDVLFVSEDLRGQRVVNTARSRADNAGEVETDHTVKVPRPSIVGGKTSDKAVYQKNEIAHYTLTASNPDEKIIGRNLTFEDTVEVDHVEILADSIRVLNPKGKDITGKCQIKAEKTHFFVKTGHDINPGETYTLTYDMRFSEDSPVGEKVPNTFIPMVDGASFAAEYETTVPGAPDVTAVKSCDPENGSTVHTGDEITYHITVKNNGDAAAKNILIRDRVPDLTEYVKGGETFEIGDDLYVKFLVKELGPGKEETVSFTVKVTGEGYARIDNTAQVKSVPEKPEDHFTDEDFADTNTVVHYIPYNVIPEEPEGSTGNPTLKIEKTSDKKVYQVGETGHYTVVTTQVKENMTAKNLVLKDEIQTKGAKIVHGSVRIKDPKGKDITTKVTKLIATDTAYQCDTGMDLKYGESFTVTYDVLFEAETLAGKQVVNIARSKADNASVETENDVTPILIEEGLTALKTSDPVSGTVVKKGQEITYTITLTNTGKEDKKNVYVMDAVPDHTEYVVDSAAFILEEQKDDRGETKKDTGEEEAPADQKETEDKASGGSESTEETASAGESSTEEGPAEENTETSVSVRVKPSLRHTVAYNPAAPMALGMKAAAMNGTGDETGTTEKTDMQENSRSDDSTEAAEETTEPSSETAETGKEDAKAAEQMTENKEEAVVTTEVTTETDEDSDRAKDIDGTGTTEDSRSDEDTEGEIKAEPASEESQTTESAPVTEEKEPETSTQEPVSTESIPGETAAESVAGKGELRTAAGKDYVTWSIPELPAGSTALLSFKVRVSDDAAEEDLVLNKALVKDYGDKVPQDPWSPEEYVPTNETVHPLSPWTETRHTVDVEKKTPEKGTTEKKKEEPATKEKERSTQAVERPTESTTEKPPKTEAGTTQSTSSKETSTKETTEKKTDTDREPDRPKGGVQTGIQSHEVLYASIAAGMALAAIFVYWRRKKKCH